MHHMHPPPGTSHTPTRTHARTDAGDEPKRAEGGAREDALLEVAPVAHHGRAQEDAAQHLECKEVCE